MTSVNLYKQDGSQNGTVELNDAVFGVEPNENVVFDAILRQRASLRQGTHAVKNRSAVSGGGKKPWRQKGTGRARQGSIRSPQFRGGGIVFGLPALTTILVSVASCFVFEFLQRSTIISLIKTVVFIAFPELEKPRVLPTISRN